MFTVKKHVRFGLEYFGLYYDNRLVRTYMSEAQANYTAVELSRKVAPTPTYEPFEWKLSA